MAKKINTPPDSAFEYNPLLDDPESYAAHLDLEKNGGEGWTSRPLCKKQVNIRLPEVIVNKLRIMAEKEGLKYQTLINSILTKYANTH